MSSHSYAEYGKRKRDDFWAVLVTSLIFNLIIGVSLLVSEEEVRAFVERFF